ncbi:MAG TPA: GAF domain-containing protein, partial [Bradyrhizobium sp.]|nr:GAF domain-containing protein [Bradyrhizobium sp.]
SPSARALLTRRIVEISDILDPATPDFTRRIGVASGFRSITFVPLIHQARGIGTIILTHSKAGFKLSEKQLGLLQTFADQAVIAIENTRLFDEVQARTQDLTESLQQQTATAEVLKAISHSAFDLEPALLTVCETAARLCAGDQAAIYKREGDVYRFVASFGFPLDYENAWRAAGPIAHDPQSPLVGHRSITERRPVQILDVTADPSYFSAMRGQSEARTALGVPLLREGDPVGYFVLARRRILSFTERQIELIQTFADQAVIAIENARLFEEVQARTHELATSLDELRTAQDRLVQTEKLASLGQLTAGIAHEIKNPLNFVNNFSALSAELTDELSEVLKPAALDDKTREEVGELTQMLKDNLAKVVQHGKRADSIVKNMLLHSREGSGEHRPADINALVDESLNLAYHGARAEKPGFNVTLQKDFDETAGTIEMFPQEITRVFLNLISNGFYAATKRKMENGGSGFEPIISATTKNLGHAVEIRIRDNGAGIPPEVKEKMFNPFFTTKPAGEGTGLGLSMSYDIIVKQHGGRIDVETEPDRFTEFTVILPRTNNPANKEKTRGQP